MASRETVLKILAMCEMFFDKNLQPGMADLYQMAWTDVPDAHLQAAFQQWIATGTRFPYPVDLRSIAQELTSPGYLSPAEAWEEAVKARKDFYPGQPRRYIAPPLVEKTIKAIGGIGMLFEATDEQNISHRAQFLAAYRQFVERAQAEIKQLPAVMAVRAQIQAPNYGAASVVGDVVKALAEARRE